MCLTKRNSELPPESTTTPWWSTSEQQHHFRKPFSLINNFDELLQPNPSMNFYKNWWGSPSTSILRDPIEISRPNSREPGVAFAPLPSASLSTVSWRIRLYFSNHFNYAAETSHTSSSDISLPSTTLSTLPTRSVRLVATLLSSCILNSFQPITTQPSNIESGNSFCDFIIASCLRRNRRRPRMRPVGGSGAGPLHPLVGWAGCQSVN